MLSGDSFFVAEIGLGGTAVPGLRPAARLLGLEDFAMGSGASPPLGESTFRKVLGLLRRRLNGNPAAFCDLPAERRAHLIRRIIRICPDAEESSSARREAPPGAAGKGAAAWRGEYVGRGDPCPCGSGREYKRCCGRSPETAYR